jgi:site-specific recombinase XerD
MVELLLHTGMRSSELLNLKVPDIYKDGESYYVRIRQSSAQETLSDPRWNKPSIKNIYSIRVVAISKLLFLGFEKYLAAGRKKKSSKINHGFLFMSERERPLAQNSLSVVLKRIQDRLNEEYPEAVAVTPHALRHTFVERMLKYLLEIKHIDMERAKDELRNICGWSANSPMPNHYARRYIAEIANAHNLERINYLQNS